MNTNTIVLLGVCIFTFMCLITRFGEVWYFIMSFPVIAFIYTTHKIESSDDLYSDSRVVQ